MALAINMRSWACVFACGIVVSAAPTYDLPYSTTGGMVTGRPPQPLLLQVKPSSGAQEPLDRLPWTSTRGKSAGEISGWSGMTFEVLKNALDGVKAAYKVGAKLANISEEYGPDVLIGANAVRFYQLDPLITINFNIDEVTFYQHQSSFSTTSNIGRHIDGLTQTLCKNDKEGYAAELDYLGQIHHKFVNDPTLQQNADLGLFLKDAEAELRAIAAFTPKEDWNDKLSQQLMQPLRYLRWSTWHVSQCTHVSATVSDKPIQLMVPVSETNAGLTCTSSAPPFGADCGFNLYGPSFCIYYADDLPQ